MDVLVRPMSALSQKQTSVHGRVMSALPPKADIAQRYSILLSTVMLRRAAGLAQNVGIAKFGV
jgi:hypothetical protein